MSNPKWYRDAICAHVDPRLFFTERERDVARAKAICSHCTVVRQCRAEALALGDEFGIRAGLTPAERGVVVVSIKVSNGCGTRAGYQRHRKLNEEPCDPCARANHEYGQAYTRIRAVAVQAKEVAA